ncbi:Protein TIFY 4B [Linum perenne]
MQPSSGDTPSRSPLDKPLHLLTEDDISQLTREDCRRFLKEKGMRRPSWNKSQAIQQVISLKTLLEPPPESEDGQPPRRRYIPRPDNTYRVRFFLAPANPAVSVRVTDADNPISASADDSAPYRRHDPPLNNLPASNSLPPAPVPAVHHAATENGSTGAASEQHGQMTIFYCGKVNVYDDMPRDKARVILQLAAGPLPMTQDSSSDASQPVWPFPGQAETHVAKAAQTPSALPFSSLPTGSVPRCRVLSSHLFLFLGLLTEGPAGRKASVQRYLEKRKDRFKHKRKLGMPTSANLDIYLNNRVGDQVLNDQWGSTDACSSPQSVHPQPSMRCISAENTAKHSILAADLSAKDVREC